MESINRSKAHDYAYEIEIILRRVFAHKYAYNHELFNFIIADLIEYDPVIAITFTLGYLLNQILRVMGLILSRLTAKMAMLQ